jgi:hypothetical protein
VAPNHSKVRGLTVRFNDLRLLVPVITELKLINYGATDLLRNDFDGDSLRLRIMSTVHTITSKTMGSDWAVGRAQNASLVELRPSVLKRKSIAEVGLLCDGQGEVHIYNGLGNIDIDVYETSDFFRRVAKQKRRFARLIGASLLVASITAGFYSFITLAVWGALIGLVVLFVGPWLVEE